VVDYHVGPASSLEDRSSSLSARAGWCAASRATCNSAQPAVGKCA